MEIRKFKKSKDNLYELEFDDGIIIKLYDDVIVKYNLLINKKIDNKTLKEITDYNDSLSAYYMAIKYLNIKLRSELEIKQYLEKKEYSKDIIDKTIAKLNKDGYLDHKIYLKSYINDNLNFNNYGPLKIKFNLVKLGFKEEEINPYLNISFNKKISSLINKKVKLNHKLSTSALKLSISNYLINLGYPKELFINYLDKIKVNDQEQIKKDYNLLYNKYKNKYDKDKLMYFLKDKLYKKGYNIDEISEVIK
jgi:regulatory protein